MDALFFRAVVLTAAVGSLGASYRTTNFIVSAPSEALAREVAEQAEAFRRDLAIEWLGRELPRWREPCPIHVSVGQHLGAGGQTSFSFDRSGTPFNWEMSIQGSRERVLDSVLPHEVTHTIFATHFGGPLPRWADEGACTTVEHESERLKQQRLLIEHLSTDRGIAFNRMFAMRQYPRDILPLYTQGYSLARFLIQQGGKQRFVKYVEAGMRSGDWPRATRDFYGYDDLSELQLTWVDWVRNSSPPLDTTARWTGDVYRSTAVADASTEATSDIATQPVSLSSEPLDSATTDAVAGWYARQHDRVGSGTALLPPFPSGENQTPAAGNRQTLTNPQPAGRVQPRVLDWGAPLVPYPRR